MDGRGCHRIRRFRWRVESHDRNACQRNKILSILAVAACTPGAWGIGTGNSQFLEISLSYAVSFGTEKLVGPKIVNKEPTR